MLVCLCCWVSAAQAQKQFVRIAEIPADTLDPGGFGNVVAGVDFDKDGKVEIYTTNNDWYDIPGRDLIPRLYKYELNGGNWERVWRATIALNFQNTWPAMAAADLDKDGKMEIVYGPVNNFGSGAGAQPNPARILVFETVGDGSDVMGVSDGAGGYKPNAQWTIATQNNQEIRPFRWFINDIDKDGRDEIVASLRSGVQRLQVYSVNNIPDNGNGSEAWSLEFSGNTGTAALSFYDLAIVDSTIYAIRDNGAVTAFIYSTSGDTFRVGRTQNAWVPGGSWKSSSVVDLDGDGKKEIVVAGSFGGVTTNQIWLLQQDADSLKRTQLVDLPTPAGRIYGGAAGDIDNNGRLDFVFGSRESTPRGLIHRLQYNGGNITDPSSYALTRIDSLAGRTSTQFDVIALANMDSDADLEVVYTGTPRGSVATDPPQPIVILDLQNVLPVELASFTASVVGNGVELNWTTATETNNYGFEVQRSTDQKNFQRLGFVAGNGTTTAQHSYKFADRDLTAGTYYYRLKQIDTDGTFSLSEFIRADIATVVREYALLQNYPNPFNPTTTIAFSLKDDGFVKLRLFNMLGQQVVELVNGQLKAGSHTAILDARNLSSGTYLYILEVNGFRGQKRLQIIK
jgi:hypothetical protein